MTRTAATYASLAVLTLAIFTHGAAAQAPAHDLLQNWCEGDDFKVALKGSSLNVIAGGSSFSFKPVVFAGCKDGICAYDDKKFKHRWTTRRTTGKLIFNGPIMASDGTSYQVKKIRITLSPCR